MMRTTLTRIHPLRAWGMAALLLLAPAGAPAATVTDDFGVDVDYSVFPGVDPVWDGMWNEPAFLTTPGFGQFQAIDGVLRVSTSDGATSPVPNLGWEGNRSSAPGLYTTVAAGEDFTATVKINSQTSGQWSAAGIIARAPSPTPPGTGTDNADENFATMYSFRTNAGVPDEGITLMKRIQAGAQITDTAIGINSTVPANQAPLPLLVRLERVGGGTTYRGYVSTDNGATWQFQSRTRPDAGNLLRDLTSPMEVGLSFMNFSALAGTVEFDDFRLDTYAPRPAPGAPTLTSAIDITATRGELVSLNLADISGLNTEVMQWNLIPDAANPAAPTTATLRVLPALLPGGGATAVTQGGKPALADALGDAFPATFAQDGSTIFRWNTDVAFNPNTAAGQNPTALPPVPWTPGVYKWTVRATNDWLEVSNDLTLTITLLVPEPATMGLGGMALAAIVSMARRRRR